jgi:hypothetical protein
MRSPEEGYIFQLEEYDWNDLQNVLKIHTWFPLRDCGIFVITEEK